MQLRDYQSQTLEALYSALQTELNVLLSSPCGSGKTVVASTLIQTLLRENPSFRILILVDRDILIQQFRNKLLTLAPELFMNIGIVCASTSNIKDHSRQVTIASRQSLVNRLNDCEAFQLIVIDEVHMAQVPEEGKDLDQFGVIIKTFREYNPKTRLLGITASPFRLGQGYIFGDRNAPGCMPYFPELTHQITIDELQRQGYLVPLIGKKAASSELTERLSHVRMIGGEYNLGEISDIMSQGVHIDSAVEVWKKYISDRKKTLAFAITISHADKLERAFNAAGIPAMAIHSDLDDLESYVRMQALKKGEAKVFISVAKLTVGLDVTDVDAILMARPTQSPALYLQCLGRGARTAPGKQDCYVIDLVNNGDIHGTDLDNLKVRYKQFDRPTAANPAGLKYCPSCEIEMHPAVRVCPECGHEFEFEADTPDMADVKYGSEPPREVEVLAIYGERHTGKKSGQTLLKVRVEIDLGLQIKTANMWICLAGDGYTGYAVTKGKALWEQLTYDGVPLPHDTEEALMFIHSGALCKPARALVDMGGRWPEVKELIYDTSKEFVDKAKEEDKEEEMDVPF